eukprot:11333_1
MSLKFTSDDYNYKEDYLHPTLKGCAIHNSLLRGNKRTLNKEVIKMGLMEIEQWFIFKYYKSIYCVLTEDNIIRYYRNKNDYYINKPNALGVIILCNYSTKVQTLTNNQIMITTLDGKKFKIKCKDEQIRNEWFDVMHKICFNYNRQSMLIVNGYVHHCSSIHIPNDIIQLIRQNIIQ